jgi:C-terminal processing protease CtpA/Prc
MISDRLLGKKDGRLVNALAFLAITLTACSSEEDGDAGASGGTGGSGETGGSAGAATDECSPVGSTRCEGPLVQTCEDGPDGSRWAEAVPCPDPLEVCRGAACAGPTNVQLEQLDSIAAYADALVNRSAWFEPVDRDALVEQGQLVLLAGSDDDDSYYRALRAVHAGVPQGHQTLYPAACGTSKMPFAGKSRFGVCGRPRGDEIVITYAREGNLLGLSAGDVVESVEAMAGDDLFREMSSRIVCLSSAPSAAGDRANVATTLFSVLRPDETVRVRSVDGTVKTVVIPSQADAQATDCQDPLGRDIGFDAESYVRPDGIAVIRLPRFFPLDPPAYDPNDPDSLQALIDDMTQKVLTAFESVKDQPMLIWDARSNYGGITPVGLAIVGGMPGAKATSLSYCQARIANSSPPSYHAFRYAVYAIEPGGPFAYGGKVAVLIDELDYSAADYFPLAVAAATDALLVGTPTAGAYGGSGPMETLPGAPSVYFTIDGNRCSDASTDEPLEGRSVQPHRFVEYDPQDLADGVDTVMEAAVKGLTEM